VSELRDDLESLIKSPGWHWLEQQVKAYWANQLDNHVASAANETDDAIALAKLRQVVASHKAVRQVMTWPQEELKRLTTPKPSATPFTRGGI